MITTLIIIATVAYCAQMVFLFMGLVKADHVRRIKDFEPTVSVIVAARNEEHCIEQCLKSLAVLDYPREKLEIIILNDRSTDRTQKIVEAYMAHHPMMRMLTTRTEKGNLRGKTNAIAQGIEIASGEILMFTDADCTVPQRWVRETVQCFGEQTGIVGGFTLLDAKRTFEGIQTLDWIFLFGLASSTAGWNIPLTVIGNNLSIRRSAYDATGGYSQIPFSVTEDYAIVQAILRKTRYRVRFPLNPNALVKSKPCQNWKQLYRQKQRWGVGGLDMVPRGFLIMAVGWLFNLMLIIGIFMSTNPMWIGALASKIFIDLTFLWKPLRRFGSLSYLKYFAMFEFYFTIYVLAIPFIAVLSKKVIWKERAL